MAYGIQNLRRSAVFDNLTPGSGSNNRSDEDSSGSFGPPDEPQSRGDAYDTLYGDEPQPQQQSGLAKLADVSVDPDKGNEQERLKGYLDTVQGAYTPNYNSRDRNDNLLDNFPTRGQPTKMDRTAAILMSLGQKDAADIQEKVLQAPYYRDRADWVTKSEPFYKAAQLENNDNTNTRQVLGTAASTFTQGERVRQASDAANQRYDLGQRKLQLEEFKANNPDLEFDFSGPNIMAVDPTGRRPPTNLGPTGKMSELDKIILQGKNARDVAHIRADATTGAAQIRANSPNTGASGGADKVGYDDEGNPFYWDKTNKIWADVNRQGRQPIGTVNTVSAGTREPVNTASNTAKALENKINDIFLRDPAGAKQVFTRQNDGSYIPKERPTPSRWRDNSAEIANYDRIMKQVIPDYQPPGFQNEGPPPASNTGPNNTGNTGSPDLRQKAEAMLRAAGKPVTPANIDYLIKMKRVQ